jgi:F-type H+-transporting ATPase subunit b
MVEINLTIVIQVVQFLILLFILNRILFRPISQAIEERDGKIAEARINMNHEIANLRSP